MALIQLTTIDDDFSYKIKKNPNTGMILRNIRKGTAFGWFSNYNHTYNAYFKDADNDISYGAYEQSFEYLNTTQYNSPLAVLNLISEFFSSNIKEDDGNNNKEKELSIKTLHIPFYRHIEFFKQYFKDFEIETEHLEHKTYQVKITTHESIHKLMNYANLLLMFLALTSEEYLDSNASTIEKYLSSIERLDAPFFIRYLFSRNMLRSKNQFSKYRSRLEKTDNVDIVSMEFGDTAVQRKRAIRKRLDFNKEILDIGCGEGFYALDFSKEIKDFTYSAIDIEESLTSRVNLKAERKQITNIKTYNHIDEYVSDYNQNTVDVILTEVIEHMPQSESVKLINTVIDNVNFDKFIITVPNKDFNKFYMISDDEFRHDDHDWEPTESEFKTFIETNIDTDKFELVFFNIGDMVNNHHTSLGVTITKK